jgi:glutamine amidotransferase
VVTSDPDVVRRAERIVVPGQGAFADCVSGLATRGLDGAVREAIAAGKPYLGICLGLQVLFDESEEHGPCRGLGILRGRVVRFAAAGLKVPHMGWNSVHGVSPWPSRWIDEGAYVYFVHSYHVTGADPTVVALTSDYGGAFCAAVRSANIFACQFHPEKSQAVGLRLLAGFVGWRP